MSDTITRYVAVVLLFVQGLASLGRGESLCIPLESCGDVAAAHRHHHHGHLDGSARRSFVAHRHGCGGQAFTEASVHHACDHVHAAVEKPGDRGCGHDHHDGDAAELPREHGACCGDHLHFNLSDHDLPPRSGSTADLLLLAIDLPATSSVAVAIRAEILPREARVGQAWIRSDQRRTIDVASIVV